MILTASLSAIAEQVASNLGRAAARGDVALITTPILAYGHTFVPVALMRNGNGIMVSDQGFARREVSMLGGDGHFGSRARRCATHYGISCDGDLFYTLEGAENLDAIIAAVAAVANAVKDTVEGVIQSLVDKDNDYTRDRVFATLRKSFGRDQVALGEKARLRGDKEEWEFDAVVSTRRSQLAILLLAPHANSVTTAFSKFSDIAHKTDHAPAGIGIVGTEPVPKISLLNDVARIMPVTQATEISAWQKLAA